MAKTLKKHVVSCNFLLGILTERVDKLNFLVFVPFPRERRQSAMLEAHREYQLFDIRSGRRIPAPEGRVLIGCLDEEEVPLQGQVHMGTTKKSLFKDLTSL